MYLVRGHNYLDKLQKIYPHEEGERNVEEGLINSIRESFAARDNNALLNNLLDLEKFPYKDYYVAFLRKDRGVIIRNPETIGEFAQDYMNRALKELLRGLHNLKKLIQERDSNLLHGRGPNIDGLTWKHSEDPPKALLCLTHRDRKQCAFVIM